MLPRPAPRDSLRPMEMPAQPSGLARSVGIGGVAAFVLNGIVGAGVFAFPALVAAQAGGAAPLVVVLVGVVLLPVVLVMARLATLYRGTGGPILYVEEAFGRTAGFQIGWMQLLSSLSALAANVNVLADYLLRAAGIGTATPALATVLHPLLVAGAIALLALLNLGRVAGVSRLLQLGSVAKLAPLVLLIVLAVPVALAGGAAPADAAGQDLVKAGLVAAFAFVGFEGALTVAGEARHPERDMPRAVILVFAGVTALYALLCWAYVAIAFAPGPVDTAPLATLAARLIGGAGALVVTLTAAISVLGNTMFTVLISSRRLVVFAGQGTAPGWFGRLSVPGAVPRNAVVAICAVATLLALSGGFTALALISVASRLLVYLGCIAALPVIERRRGLGSGTAQRVVLVAAALVALALIAGTQPAAWLGLGAAVASGAVVYALGGRGARKPG